MRSIALRLYPVVQHSYLSDAIGAGQGQGTKVPVRGIAGAGPEAEAAVTAQGGVLVHANDLEMGAAGSSTGNIVRCMQYNQVGLVLWRRVAESFDVAVLWRLLQVDVQLQAK